MNRPTLLHRTHLQRPRLKKKQAFNPPEPLEPLAFEEPERLALARYGYTTPDDDSDAEVEALRLETA